MRATFFGIELGKRALLAQRAAMDVTSQNIANANTEGYARQRALLSATDPWSVPGMNAPVTGQQLGTGVEVTKIENMRDTFIDEKIVRETSNKSEYEVASDLMQQVETIFNEPNESTVRDMFDKFWAAWQDLSVSPSRSELRTNLTEQAQSLVSFFKDVDSQLRTLQGTPDHSDQGSIENQLENAVTQANNLTRQIASLNLEIDKAELAQGQANDLRDRRQLRIEELSKLIKVDTSWDSKGHLTLRAGHELLVENNVAHELNIYQKEANLPNTVGVDRNYPEMSDKPGVASAVITNTSDNRNLTLTVAQTAQANSLHTYLSFFPLNGSLSDAGVSSGTFYVNGRMFYLDAANTSIQGLAAMLDTSNLNIKSSTNDGGQLIMTSALTGSQNAIQTADGTSNLFNVLNLQQDQEARDARFSIDGKDFVTAENVVRDAVPGVAITLNSVGVANLDLRPVVNGGKIKGLLEVRDGNIDKLRDKLDQMAYRLVTEVNDVHRQGFGLDGKTGRNFFKPLASDDPNQPYKDSMKDFAIEDFIKNDVNTIAAAQGTIENPNDKLPTFNGQGDGSNAIVIAQIKGKAFFNDGKADFNEYYNGIVTLSAGDSQGYERQKTFTEDLMTQLSSKRDEISGVALDEELSNLIKFQQAYNAAAKAITTADEMLDKIINNMI